MVATLLRLVGLDLKRLARQTAATVVLAMLGAFAAILALACGFVALYLWLKLELGTFAALGIVGGASALLAVILFAVAWGRAARKPAARAEEAVRRAADSVEASAAAIARAADEALDGAANTVRNGSPRQIAGTIAAAALIGWVLGRRL